MADMLADGDPFKPRESGLFQEAPAEMIGHIGQVVIERASRNALAGRLAGGERSAA